jgi:hypothetical protein
LKYWRGFLTAGIVGACTLALTEFAKTHPTLVDMIFPYISRMISGSMAEWSSGVSFCLWQVFLVLCVLAVCTLLVLAIVLRWNVLQVTGWITAAASVILFLQFGVFGINRFAGPLADDIQMPVTNYDIAELEEAAKHFLNEAKKADDRLPGAGKPKAPGFEALAAQAPDGFHALVYDRKYSIFANSTVPVKKLSWSGYYTGTGTTGMTVSLTGESAVNPEVPGVLMPYAMCHEMAHRISIYADRDANFAAFLACTHNSDPYFVYSGYLNAYRYCFKALQSFNSENARAACQRLAAEERAHFGAEIKAIDSFYKSTESANDFRNNVQLLVSWYIQDVYLPNHVEDEDTPSFDPMDEEQVDLSGLIKNPA